MSVHNKSRGGGIQKKEKVIRKHRAVDFSHI